MEIKKNDKLNDELLGANPSETMNILNSLLKGHNGFIAGGCFKNFYANEEPKDIDIFFRNREDFNQAVKYFESSKNNYNYFSGENSKKFLVPINQNGKIKVDLISYTFGTPSEVINNFDFDICKVAYYKENGEHYLMHIDDIYAHLYIRKLNISGVIIEPDITLKRLLRYTRYGYTINSESLTELVRAINKMDKIEDIELDEEDYLL